MGVIFSKIEKFFDKKYKYNVYNYNYDSIVKNDVDAEEEECLIYDNNDYKKARIDYYNKKLEGIMYL